MCGKNVLFVWLTMGHSLCLWTVSLRHFSLLLSLTQFICFHGGEKENTPSYLWQVILCLGDVSWFTNLKCITLYRLVKGDCLRCMERWGIMKSSWTSFALNKLVKLKERRTLQLYSVWHTKNSAVICATFHSPWPRWQSCWLIMITMFSLYFALTSQCWDKLLFFQR